MREMRELRTETAKTFDLGAGQRRAVEYPGPIHYETHGKWLEIEPTWVRTGDGWKVRGTPYRVTVDVQGVGYTYNGSRVELLDCDVCVEPVAVGHRLWWLTDDLQLCLIAHAEGLSLQHILMTPDAPQAFRLFTETQPEPRDWWGRENIEDRVDRGGLNQHREIVVDYVTEEVEGGWIATTTWTGQAYALDDQRRKSLTDEITYPVRIR